MTEKQKIINLANSGYQLGIRIPAEYVKEFSTKLERSVGQKDNQLQMLFKGYCIAIDERRVEFEKRKNQIRDFYDHSRER